MNQTWWRNHKDVDPDQAKIYSLPPGGKHLVLGPPGSGKTNVLLLRAIYLARAGRPNLKVLTFGRSLVEFIKSGVRENGLIDEDRIQTVAWWQTKLIVELTGKGFSYSCDEHNRQRRERCAQLKDAIARNKIQSSYYDVLLVDEAQDLISEEVEVISLLANELYFVGDSRQRIYDENEGLEAVRKLGVEEHNLRWHYRIGRKICRAADRMLPSAAGALTEFCQYNEDAQPSTVGLHKLPSRHDQMNAICARLETQLRAYPDEWIGVIAPKNFLLEEFLEHVSNTKLARLLCVHRDGARYFDPARPIVAMTAHSAKGTEFRAVHMLAAEEYSPRFKREIGFTAITRAKTAVDCYYTNSVDGALLAAFAEERIPDLTEVFP